MEKRNELSSLEKTSLGFKGKVKGVVSYVARGIKDAAQDYIAHPVRNTVLTLGMAAYIGCAGPGSTSVSDDPTTTPTEQSVAPEYYGPTEVTKYVGDARSYDVEYISENGDLVAYVANLYGFSENETSDVSGSDVYYPEGFPDNKNYVEVVNKVEPGFGEIAAIETNVYDSNRGRNLNALELFLSNGGKIPRGTNDNVSDNILGDYAVTMTGFSGSNDVSVIHQDGFLLDYGNGYSAVITGFENGTVGLSELYVDGNGNPSQINFIKLDILLNGNLRGSGGTINFNESGDIYSSIEQEWAKK